LREWIIYGDNAGDSGLTQAQATASNLLGKPYKRYDDAGLLTLTVYDFKSNLLDSTRNVIAESPLLAIFNSPPANWALTPLRVDWGAANPPPLDTTAYETTTTYDALNRVITLQYPQSVDGARKLLIPQYNTAGALESVALDGVTHVDRIAYNAKGQRILIAYGNGQMTRYAYDPQTFRLLRMRTESYTKPSATTYHPASPAAPLQEFGYAYDLAGNVLTISDRTPGSGIQNTALGTDALNRNFIYDPIYRLISATGRECDLPPPPPPWTDTPRCTGTDITKVRGNTEAYQYDNVGNMAFWAHTSTDTAGNASRTNRQFALVAGANQLKQLTIGSTSYQYTYDANGNLVQENTERHFEWDQSDRMRVFRIQPDGAPPSVYTQYLYDSSGQRVMKLGRNQGGGYETTIYIGGVFEHRRSVSGATTVENNLLHVMDNKSRVAIVRVGNALPGDGAPDVPIQYHFGDHLGSSNVVVSDSGAWVNREEYLPYGETGFGSYARKRYRFTGKERDEESGLYYHGARYYAPWIGRWTSCDRAGLQDGPSPYAYVRNNPIRARDPTGHQSMDSQVMGMMWQRMGQELSARIESVVGGRAHVDTAANTVQYTGPQGGVGGAVGGVARAASFRTVPIEKNPSEASLVGMEVGASQVLVLDPLERLATAKTVTGQETSRAWAAVQLFFDLLPFALEAHAAYMESRAAGFVLSPESQMRWMTLNEMSLSAQERQLIHDVVNAPEVTIGRSSNVRELGHLGLDVWREERGIKWSQGLQDAYNLALNTRTRTGRPVNVMAGWTFTQGEKTAAEMGARQSGIVNVPYWPDVDLGSPKGTTGLQNAGLLARPPGGKEPNRELWGH
jgi:RHS repeat-associated protein